MDRPSPQKRDYARHLRKNQTEAEVALWSALRGKQIDGFKFRRQATIGEFIVDFVCYEAKLIIEVDGAHHDLDQVVAYDRKRTEWLESQGFQVLRFHNADAVEDFHVVRRMIRDALSSRGNY